MSFFFQAEDGIRDHCVTGVQTCALPISGESPRTAGVKSCEFPELPIGSDMLLPLAQGGTIHSRFGLALVRVLRKHLLSGENAALMSGKRIPAICSFRGTEE